MKRINRITVAGLILAVLAPLSAAAGAWAASSTQPASPQSSTTAQPAARPTAVGPAAVVRLSGEIDEYNLHQLKLRFDRARSAGAKTIILEIDTYGGQLPSGLDISRFIKNQQDLYVIAFVNSKAISAGAMAALACNEIVMMPSATLGDCAVIVAMPGVGVAPMGDTERGKFESPIPPDFEESAKRSGYSVDLVMTMVLLDRSVYWLENSAGDRRFANEPDAQKLMADGWKPVAGESSPIDGPKSLLTVNTDQAIRYGLATGTATSAEDLAAQRGLQVVGRYEHGVGDDLIGLLSGPIARGILLIIFINALLIALKTPGTGAAELVAVLSLGIMIGVPAMTGYASWWEIGLVIGGLALILFEVFILPGHFVSAVVGTIMLLTGLVLTFVGDVSTPAGWSAPGIWDGAQRGIQVTVFGLAAAMLVFAIVRQFLPKLPGVNKLILTATSDGPAGTSAATAGGSAGEQWPFVGTVGVTTTDLKPGGAARFPFGADAQTASVVNDGGFVPAGTRVIVREVHGSHIVVRPV